MGKPEGKTPLGRLRLRRGITLKCVMKKCNGGGRVLDLSGSGLGQLAGYGDHSNETSGYLKCGRFFHNLRNFLSLKKDSAPWSRSVGWLVGWFGWLVGWLVG